jgi:hypothetical protein
MEYSKKSPKKFNRPTYAADYIETDAPRAVYLDNAHTDNLMIVVYALGTELWAERQRGRVIEALLEAGTPVTREAIERYEPSAEELAQWQADQDAMIKRLYGVLARDTSLDRKFGDPRFPNRKW